MEPNATKRRQLRVEFEALVLSDEDDIPLWDCAMAAARVLQDGVTWPGSAGELTRLAELARVRLETASGDRERAEAILGVLREQGYRGDMERYEDVRNSLVDRVLERRRGLPITLSVLALHLADGLGVDLQGVAFPGHFLVGRDLESAHPGIYDPFFEGRAVTPTELADRYHRLTDIRVGADAAQLRAHLRPVPARLILSRMLGNLQRHYLLRGVHDRAAQVADLLAVVHPEVEDYKRVQGELEDRLRRLN